MLTICPDAGAFASSQWIRVPPTVPPGDLERLRPQLHSDQAFANAHSLHDVGAVFHQFAATIGYSAFLIAVYWPALLDEKARYIVDGYPDLPDRPLHTPVGRRSDWMDLYVRRGYINHDPVVPRQTGYCRPFEWCELDPGPATPMTMELFQEAFRFGLCSGLSLRVSGPFGAHLFASFSSPQMFQLGERREAAFGAGMLFAARAIDAALRILSINPGVAAKNLNPRQLLALQLAADGLVNKEIADRLGITVDGVHHLQKEAQVKLGARSRSAAIAQAAQMGMISRYTTVNAHEIDVSGSHKRNGRSFADDHV